jgi:hypothetical protein
MAHRAGGGRSGNDRKTRRWPVQWENRRQRKLVARAFSAGVGFRLEHIAADELLPGKGVAPGSSGAREQVAASKGFRAGKLVARVLARSGDDYRGPCEPGIESRRATGVAFPWRLGKPQGVR